MICSYFYSGTKTLVEFYPSIVINVEILKKLETNVSVLTLLVFFIIGNDEGNVYL